MSYPKSSYNFLGIKATLTWILDDNLEKYRPVKQVYGVVFDNEGRILITREFSNREWQLPGGKPETKELIKETLKRELLEEVDVEIGNIYPLGAQKTEIPRNPNKEEGDLFYQLRCVVELKKLLPQTPDPDRGNVWERIFVPAEKITKYVRWGAVGEAMFTDAVKLWKEKHGDK